jgi:hypothetical protein
LPSRYVPSSGFGYPLDGFLPSIPCRFCFAPAAPLGFTLRSFLLPEGIQVITPGRTHLPFHLAVFPPMESPGRPDRYRFLGFDPPESAWQPDEGLVRRLLATPLGFALLGFSGKSLDQDFARSPLTRLAGSGPLAMPPGATEYRSTSTRPHPRLTLSCHLRVRRPF